MEGPCLFWFVMCVFRSPIVLVCSGCETVKYYMIGNLEEEIRRLSDRPSAPIEITVIGSEICCVKGKNKNCVSEEH